MIDLFPGQGAKECEVNLANRRIRNCKIMKHAIMCLYLGSFGPFDGRRLADFAKLEDALVPHALRHIGAVGTAWLGYAVALYLRRASLFGEADLGTATLAVSIVSALLLSIGGWFGGRLVYSFGAGVSK